MLTNHHRVHGSFLASTVAVLTFGCQIKILDAQGIPEPGIILYGTVRNTTEGQDVRVTSGTLVWNFKPSDGGSPVSVTTQLINLNDQFSFVLQLPCETPLASSSPAANLLRITNPPITYDRATVTLNGKPLTIRNNDQTRLTLSPAARGLVERVDLVDSQVVVESYDVWAQRLFGRTGNQNEDPDGDGMSNLSEYKAGTDPKDKGSLFAFIDVEVLEQNAGAQIKWASVAGKFYSILRSPILSSAVADYSVIASRLSATAPLNAYVDREATGSRVFFYRLKVED